jgi:hypothetical protein
MDEYKWIVIGVVLVVLGLAFMLIFPVCCIKFSV